MSEEFAIAKIESAQRLFTLGSGVREFGASGAMGRECHEVAGLSQIGVPKGSRTPVTGVKGQCPRPLDDGDRFTFLLGAYSPVCKASAKSKVFFFLSLIHI